MEQRQENWSIFSALHTALQEKKLNKLRFAKCHECGRLTPYRLNSVMNRELQCKQCRTVLQKEVIT